MKQAIYKITENTRLTESVYKMVLSGDISDITSPGQFVNIKIGGFFLRRPISVCDYEDGNITLVYKVVGGGTETLSKMQSGDELDCLSGLGNGFSLEESGDIPVLIGGGVGIPPLYALCKKLISEGKKPTVILGFNTKMEIFYEEEFRKLGVPVLVTTVDGSYGVKGYVTDALNDIDYSYFYTCGPEPMFYAIEQNIKTQGQYSFEERMGCGFGACMGCSCKTLYGNKRICKDGPVLKREEIIWK